jgi:limonene-1,2-epoxide hydrolase
MGAEQEEVLHKFLVHEHEQDSDSMADMMTDDVVWQTNVPSWRPLTGRETSRAELSRQSKMATWGLDGTQVLNIASNDRVVFAERVTVFETMAKRVTLRVIAVFEVEDGKIAAWREYYDRVALASNSVSTQTSWSRNRRPPERRLIEHPRATLRHARQAVLKMTSGEVSPPRTLAMTSHPLVVSPGWGPISGLSRVADRAKDPGWDGAARANVGGMERR